MHDGSNQGNSSVQGNVMNRLFSSFCELEAAIASAKKTLEAKGSAPQALIERLSSYDSILLRQRTLAQDLAAHMQAGNWPEVVRHVGLINGLSAMIRDDARDILGSLKPGVETEPVEDITIC